MIKFAMVFLALSATSAAAEDWRDIFREADRESERKWERARDRLDADLRAAREMDQRERLDSQRNEALTGIESQLMIMNAPPYR